MLCPASIAAERAALLLGCYRERDDVDVQIFTRAVVAIFMRYPESVVREASEPATGIPVKVKWWPQLAEIKEACEGAYAPVLRARERHRVADQHRLMLPAPGRQRPSEAERAAQVQQALADLHMRHERAADPRIPGGYRRRAGHAWEIEREPVSWIGA